MRENVVFLQSLQRAGGWCEPVTKEMQKSLLNSKAEMKKVSRAGISSLRSAAVTLLGLIDLMRCRYFICKKGGTARSLPLAPLSRLDLEGKRLYCFILYLFNLFKEVSK